MKRKTIVVLLLCLACVLCGCTGNGKNVMKDVTMLNALSSEKFPSEALQNDEYQRAYEEFASSFFRTTTAAESGKNVCLSPLSAYMAFSLCFAGSDGKTAEEFRDVFGLSKERAAEYCQALYANFLQREYVDGNTKVNLANSVWLNKADEEYVKKSFLSAATDYFNAPIYTCDFSDKKTVDAINYWCKENTDGLIDEIIKELTKDQFMAILNALLIEAAWVEPYKGSYGIITDEFTDVNGKTTEQTFLQKKITSYFYSEDAKGFGMPLRDGFSFVGILPNEDVPIGEFCAGLTAEKIRTMLLSKQYGYDVRTRIPKFSFDYETDLIKSMKAMGLIEAFDGVKANFKLLAEFPGANAYISTAIQKTHFELDENGIKAAAVTYIALGKNSAYSEKVPPKIDIFLDRPFVYLIVDDTTQLPLFVGVVNTL